MIEMRSRFSVRDREGVDFLRSHSTEKENGSTVTWRGYFEMMLMFQGSMAVWMDDLEDF